MQAFELLTSWRYIEPLLLHSQLAFQDKVKINEQNIYTSRKHVPLNNGLPIAVVRTETTTFSDL